MWQAGFYRTVAETVNLAPARVAAVSAGAAVAAVLFAGCFDAALAHFKRATGGNSRNVHWKNLFNGAPIFPHAAMYRRALLEVIDERALAALHAGPELRVAITRLPGWLGARTGFAVAGLADALEHVLGPPVHPQLAPWLGFRAEYVTVRACRTPEALADLVLASSCTPPMTPLSMQGGKPSLDGGIADNVPVAALAEATGRRSSCSQDAMAGYRPIRNGSMRSRPPTCRYRAGTTPIRRACRQPTTSGGATERYSRDGWTSSNSNGPGGHARGTPAISRPSQSLATNAGLKGHALIASETVKSGSLRMSRRAIRRASPRAPAAFNPGRQAPPSGD